MQSPEATYTCFRNKGNKHVIQPDYVLGLSHVRDQKFKDDLLDSLNLICSYGVNFDQLDIIWSIAQILQGKD